PGKYIPGILKYLCINKEICNIYGSNRYETDIKYIYENLWIAIYKEKNIAPSTILIDSIYRDHGIKAALYVKEQGLKAFLYGNDILPESVVRIIPPHYGIYSVIDPEDDVIVGFVKWNSKRRVYENIYDIGIFLRILG
ncbi:MAG: hypothetical protein QXE81_06550, partial [Desulfurococcaceae archaeon]